MLRQVETIREPVDLEGDSLLQRDREDSVEIESVLGSAVQDPPLRVAQRSRSRMSQRFAHGLGQLACGAPLAGVQADLNPLQLGEHVVGKVERPVGEDVALDSAQDAEGCEALVDRRDLLGLTAHVVRSEPGHDADVRRVVADGEVVVAPRACRVRHLLDRGLPVGPGRVAVEISSYVVEARRVRPRPRRSGSSRSSGGSHSTPSAAYTASSLVAVRQLSERVDVLGRARRRDQGRAETMRLGDDERDRNTLDGDTDDATFAPFDDGDDHRKSLERCELRPRIFGSAHDR